MSVSGETAEAHFGSTDTPISDRIIELDRGEWCAIRAATLDMFWLRDSSP